MLPTLFLFSVIAFLPVQLLYFDIRFYSVGIYKLAGAVVQKQLPTAHYYKNHLYNISTSIKRENLLSKGRLKRFPSNLQELQRTSRIRAKQQFKVCHCCRYHRTYFHPKRLDTQRNKFPRESPHYRNSNSLKRRIGSCSFWANNATNL